MSNHFALVLAAFRGERFALDEHGAQALWFALETAAADLSITPEAFHIRPTGHHDMDYPLESAAGVMSFLLERVGSVGPRSIKTWIASTTIHAGRFPAWTSPARHILAEAWIARVMVRIRADESALDDELPTLSDRKFARYTHECPHCGQVPERYRVLSDGSLVCPGCGASSAKPPGARISSSRII